MIRPDLGDLINRHKQIKRLNNNNNNNTDRGEWKIMLIMHIKRISTKCFIETRTMHPKSRQVEVYMGSVTENVIDILLIHFYKIFNVCKKRQMKEEANLFLIVLNY